MTMPSVAADTSVTSESPERCRGQSVWTDNRLVRSILSLHITPTCRKTQWKHFKTLVSAKLTTGPKKKVHQDWFDKNDERIKQLIDDKKKASISARMTTPLQTRPKAGPGGTLQNAGRVVRGEG